LKTLLDRFNEKWVGVPESGCWLWTGSVQSSGYGEAHDRSREHRHVGAHRLAWELFRGAIPEGLWVLHKCDVKLCVNPLHLFLGTRQENMDDMKRKGRQAKGDRSFARRFPEKVRRGDAHPRKASVVCIDGGKGARHSLRFARGCRGSPSFRGIKTRGERGAA